MNVYIVFTIWWDYDPHEDIDSVWEDEAKAKARVDALPKDDKAFYREYRVQT